MPDSTALFTESTDVPAFRAENLGALSSYLDVAAISDASIWSSLRSAEADASRQLRVLFEPTVVIPEDAPDDEVEALTAAETKFVQESPYDYDPATWSMDAWGFIVLRQRPVARVDSVRFTYPSAGSTVLDIPTDWFRLDKKYGHLRIVPTGTLMGMGPFTSYLLQAMSAGRIIPNMIHIRYVAGLQNAADDYPDLVSLVKRMAALKIIKGAFLPQSGSISADGLSQSSSVDTSKWQDEVDHDLEVLRESIHGIRLGVL